jgi:hypothetical protein
MINNKTLVASILAAGLLAGCAGDLNRTAGDFGNSVRAMNQAQIMDPVAARNPDRTPVEGTDAQRMENALDNYRTDVAKPESTRQDLIITLGD